MAAACGADADVPKNGRNLGVFDDAPSAAVRSGFASVVPPFVTNRKFPGVIGVPVGSKKIFRGPSELKVSVGFAAPPTNGLVPVLALFQYVAATLTVLRPALCPTVAPGVLTDRRPPS